MRVLQAVVEAINSYPLAARAQEPSSRSLLETSSLGSGRAGAMRVRLSDGSGAEELFQAWRAVIYSFLKIHNRLEGWPLQQVWRARQSQFPRVHASAASEDRDPEAVVRNQRARVARHCETTARLSVRPTRCPPSCFRAPSTPMCSGPLRRSRSRRPSSLATSQLSRS